MLTTDFSGTYDYEREEAEHAAQYILDDLNDGYITPDEFQDRLAKERQHWKKCLPDTFDDWNNHFDRVIKSGLEQALKGYQANA